MTAVFVAGLVETGKDRDQYLRLRFCRRYLLATDGL